MSQDAKIRATDEEFVKQKYTGAHWAYLGHRVPPIEIWNAAGGSGKTLPEAWANAAAKIRAEEGTHEFNAYDDHGERICSYCRLRVSEDDGSPCDRSDPVPKPFEFKIGIEGPDDSHEGTHTYYAPAEEGIVKYFIPDEECLPKFFADDPKPESSPLPAGAGEQKGVSKIFGTWPGDETEAELLAALDEVRKPVGEQAAAKKQYLIPDEECLPKFFPDEEAQPLPAISQSDLRSKVVNAPWDMPTDDKKIYEETSARSPVTRLPYERLFKKYADLCFQAIADKGAVLERAIKAEAELTSKVDRPKPWREALQDLWDEDDEENDHD